MNKLLLKKEKLLKELAKIEKEIKSCSGFRTYTFKPKKELKEYKSWWFMHYTLDELNKMKFKQCEHCDLTDTEGVHRPFSPSDYLKNKDGNIIPKKALVI